MARSKITAGNRSIEYAALVKGQQLTQALPAEDPLIPASEWKVAGRPAAKVDGIDFVTGRHRYPSDQKLPGHAVRESCCGRALLKRRWCRSDTQKAEQMGVTVVRDGNFIGVAAPNSQACFAAAAAAIHAEWKVRSAAFQ